MRISKQDYYLQVASVVATRATCIHHQYGAIIVKEDRIISTGYNGSPHGEINCCDTDECVRDKLEVAPKYGACVAVHAEQNALLKTREDVKGAVLYLYCIDDIKPAPCSLCFKMMKNAGIKEVITPSETISIN